MSDIPQAGTIALVTGAGSGIGERTAQTLADIGCRVICTGRRVERLEEVSARLGERGIALELDVTDAGSVESLTERLPEDWRDIGILVNSAGHDVGGRRLFHEGTTEHWASIIETNGTGLLRVTRQLIGAMVERGRGDVVNIGSIAGLRPYAKGTVYSASKHAVHGFSECLRLDYAGTGIRVIEILPGVVRTEFAQTRWADEQAGARFYDDFGQCLAPEDVANAVVYALRQPPHVVISQLVVVPSAQT